MRALTVDEVARMPWPARARYTQRRKTYLAALAREAVPAPIPATTAPPSGHGPLIDAALADLHATGHPITIRALAEAILDRLPAEPWTVVDGRRRAVLEETGQYGTIRPTTQETRP